MKRGVALSLGTVALGALLAGAHALRSPGPPHAPLTGPAAPSASTRERGTEAPPASASDSAACEPDDDLVAPTGRPAGLTCRTARAVVREVRARFATRVERPPPGLFADLLVGWLDPHGLWSDAPDAPTARELEARAPALLDELEAPPGSAEPCAASLVLGGALIDWLAQLRRELDAARREAPAVSLAEARTLLLVSPYAEDAAAPARALAAELGRTLGSLEQSFGSVLEPFAELSRERFVPELDASGWQGIVLASAVRAYVAAIDPHGQWTPIDEEWALYADDESFEDTERLWGEMLRTALGARIVDQPMPPLEVDDLVLAVNGTGIAGMSIEQIGQLERAAPADGSGRTVLALRAGEDTPRSFPIPAPSDDTRVLPPSDGEVELELLPYGADQVALVTVDFVGDDLGERLEGLFAELGRQGTRAAGVLLDLRGNGGGSTDGAADALGVFLPGLPVFPLLHAGRVTEVLVAPEPPLAHRFDGPVAVLVDRRTASAAEMLAGALDRYGRGVLLGAPTFGKGSVQEYFRDPTGEGALRLTTHLFVLPDGSPVQGRGLFPELLLDVASGGEGEADIQGSLEAVSGPDVRRRTRGFPSWPRLTGRVGPCPDAVICTALKRLSGRTVAKAPRAGQSPRKRRIPH
jgi:carboxyl-terminal processing protease